MKVKNLKDMQWLYLENERYDDENKDDHDANIVPPILFGEFSFFAFLSVYLREASSQREIIYKKKELLNDRIK